MDKAFYRTVNFSKTLITELMIPSYANFGGKIHGGTILSLMDKVAYACSAKHAGGYCVTASMNVVDFLAPVEVGDLVHLHASVNHVGTSSITVGVRVEAENIVTGEVRHTNSSYFTMVCLDELSKKAKPVPGLILENREDMRRFLEAMKRRELVMEYKANFRNSIDELELSGMETLLKNQNCIIEPSDQ